MRSMLPGVLLLFAAANSSAQATWVVDRVPILDVPGTSSSGVVTFGYAAGGMRLSDGQLLIADRVENSIRVFDTSGKLMRTVGRTGDGPGEFQAIVWAGRCGTDSLLVWDLRRRQASMIGASGAVARQFAIPNGDTAQAPFQFSCSSRGSMVYRSQPRPVRGAPPDPQNPNLMGVSAAAYRAGRDGSIAQRLGDIPAGEVFAITSPSGGRGAAPRPLGRNSSVGALDDAVVISSADSAIVTIVRADGRSSRHALPITLRAPTKAEFDESVKATASMAPAQMRQAMIQQLTAVPMPERLPAISALVPDSEGLMWVQTTPPGGKAVDFLVMNAAGHVVARAQVPLGLTVFEIGKDYVLGSYTDAADEMHVTVLRLRR
jgi:6-bladed beta-propeller